MATEEHASGRHGRRSSLSEALIADHDSFAGTKLKGSDGVMNGFTKQEHVHGSSPADMGGTSVRKQCPNAQNEDLDASPQPSHSSGPSAPSAANPEQLPTGWWQSNADQLHASSLPDRLTVSTGASSSSSSSEQIASYALPKHATTESIDIAGRQIEESPFSPDDSPVYSLCPDPPRKSSSMAGSNPLGTVPEDGPSLPEELLVQAPSGLAQADVIHPDTLRLPQVKTPRKQANTAFDKAASPREPSGSGGKAAAEQARRLSAGSADEAFSIDFSRQHEDTGMDAPAFNPFAASGQTAFPMSPEAMMSPGGEDAFFAMDFDTLSQHQSQEIPFGVAHLDFGARNGSGVVGPKIDIVDGGRQSDKFEVKEGEDAEIKQLLWVIENLQEELHNSSQGFEDADAQVLQQRAVADRLQEELDAAAAEEADLDEQLRVMHSKLEAQLLTKLEQEEEIRISGSNLKVLRAEIAALDKSLAAAEEQRRDLERQAAEKRTQQLKALPEKKGAGGPGAEASPPPSPRSNYSSAWETSDSEEERLDLDSIASQPQTASTIFEDNQAKMQEKGALGGSWLRSVLGGRSRKEMDAAPQAAFSTASDSGKSLTAIGSGQSHVAQPSIAAELAPIPMEVDLPEDLK